MMDHTNRLTDQVNLASKNRWIFSIPWRQINPDYSSEYFSLNIAKFATPKLETATLNVPARGGTLPYPNGVRTEQKRVRIDFLLSANYSQYKILYEWFNTISNETDGGTHPSKSPPSSYMLDCRADLLTGFKNPTMTIIYKGCWVCSIDSIPFDYRDDEEIMIGFELNYARFMIEWV